MDYTIIIPAYNEEKLLSKTLNCLNEIKSKLTKYSGEIIVVDNNSNDKTAKIAKDYNTTVIFEKENCIAKARNVGAQVANGDLLIFIDADTIVPYELIETTIALMKNKTLCGGGTTINFDIDKLSFAFKIFTYSWHFLIKVVPLAAGSYLFCLKDGWSDIGGFDETFYASEEVWFSKELKKWGRKRKLKFKILDIPVITSARKIKQYSTLHIIKVLISLILFPWMLKNKAKCHIWYERD